MKRKTLNFLMIAAYVIMVFVSSSCIKSEPLNAEADIVTCELPPDILKSDPQIRNNTIDIMIKRGLTETMNLAPVFTLTEGATISPESGTVRDFTTPQEYIVTSESGKWQKVYKVSVSESDMAVEYDFEYWEPLDKDRYYIPYEPIFSGTNIEKQMIWDSGNSGFVFVARDTPPDDYPTAKTSDSYSGKLAAKLTTKSTEPLGSLVGMRLAAGNLFIGEFNAMSAITNPLGATKFGKPFDKEPIRFTGYYKYKAGEKYQDRQGNIIPNKTDSCSIYSVIYEIGENGEMLDGSNVLTSERLVAKAVLPSPKQTDTYTRFVVEYEYLKEIDPQKLKDFKYNMAVVFSSSYNGALFEGAIGSVLYVDEVAVVCKEDNE